MALFDTGGTEGLSASSMVPEGARRLVCKSGPKKFSRKNGGEQNLYWLERAWLLPAHSLAEAFVGGAHLWNILPCWQGGS